MGELDRFLDYVAHGVLKKFEHGIECITAISIRRQGAVISPWPRTCLDA